MMAEGQDAFPVTADQLREIFVGLDGFGEVSSGSKGSGTYGSEICLRCARRAVTYTASCDSRWPELGESSAWRSMPSPINAPRHLAARPLAPVWDRVHAKPLPEPEPTLHGPRRSIVRIDRLPSPVSTRSRSPRRGGPRRR